VLQQPGCSAAHRAAAGHCTVNGFVLVGFTNIKIRAVERLIFLIALIARLIILIAR